jgi:2-dehydro-3-deoxyphosphogluconate aldolase/(4S)-4-hydroxy-2-oxoglutarate aldolase
MKRRLQMSQPDQAADVTNAIIRSGVVAIVRTTAADHAVSLTQRIWEAGLPVVEVALTTPGGLEAILHLSAASRESTAGWIIGAGTVLDGDTAQRAVEAGARLLVTPTLQEDVIAVGLQHDVATVIGCATPTEMLRATSLGASAVKVFPASQWSPTALKDLLQALPQLQCVPTGGVSPQQAGAWIQAGAVAVGVGSALTADGDAKAQVAALRTAIDGIRGLSHNG